MVFNMEKFRVGDVVNILTEPDGSATGVVVDVFHDISGEEYVSLWESYIDEYGDVEKCFNDYKASNVELIPHPDTLRLNKLEQHLSENDNLLYRIYYNPCSESVMINDGFHQDSFDTIREAIDFILSQGKP